MKQSSLATALLSSALLLSTVFAAEKPAVPSAGVKPGADKTESAIIAQARAHYPIKTCVVSGEPLGSMGEATPFIHRATGQPARVVFLCCDGCSDDFKASPAKFLKKIDDAAAAEKKSPKPADKKA